MPAVRDAALPPRARARAVRRDRGLAYPTIATVDPAGRDEADPVLAQLRAAGHDAAPARGRSCSFVPVREGRVVRRLTL